MRIILTCFLLGCSLLLSAQWTLVYENDGDGTRLSGDKATLIEAVRSGKSVRIGWTSFGEEVSEPIIEHFSLAGTIHILKEKDVYAHLLLPRMMIFRGEEQRPLFGRQAIPFLLTTTDKQYRGGLNDEVSSTLELRNDLRVMRVKWFVQ